MIDLIKAATLIDLIQNIYFEKGQWPIVSRDAVSASSFKTTKLNLYHIWRVPCSVYHIANWNASHFLADGLFMMDIWAYN